MFEGSIPANRFLVSETINGTCTACVYTKEDDYEAGGVRFSIPTAGTRRG
jgi:hypothetical protein